MRHGASLLAATALAMAVAGYWFWSRNDPSTPEQPPPTELSAAEQRMFAERMAARVSERERADPNVRAPVRAPDPAAATSPPTVRVRLVDAATGQPIAAARAFDLARAEVAATAGSDGTLVAPSLPAGRVAFLADEHWSKLPHPGDDDAVELAEAAAQGRVAEIDLHRDDFTLPCTLHFVDAAGATIASEVRCTITCLDELPPDGRSFPAGKLMTGARVDRELATAWQRHVAVQAVLGAYAAPLHLGVHSHGQVFSAAGGTLRARFAGPGTYRVEAVALAASLAGGRELHVALGEEGPIEVQLQTGRFAHGMVVDARDGRPIAGATVRLVEATASPSGVVETGPGGEFQLGPVARSHANLHVQSRRHVDVETSVAVGEACRIALTPRPERAIRGVVRRQPSLAPLAGVEVVIRSGFAIDVADKTTAAGAFSLATTAEAPELVVRAPGFLPWLERIDEPQDSYACDLIPAEPDARVQAGLTAIVEGRVLGTGGKPIPGTPVQLFADEAVIPEGIAGRAILEGHTLPLRPLAITGEDGAFTLEWHRAGVVRLVATDGVASSEDGVPVTLVLGQRARDVVLRVAR